MMRRASIAVAIALFAASAIAQPLRVGGEVKAPVAIKRVEPHYPKVKVTSGLVILEMIVTRDGNVRDIKILRGSRAYAKAAVDAIAQWKFKPATLKGKPVDVVYNMTVHLCPR